MPQQINLCTPILLTQKRYFSANTMALSTGVFVLLGGALFAFWVWSLSSSSNELQLTLNAYAKERESLQVSIKSQQVSMGPGATSLTKDLKSVRAQMEQRERLLVELHRGLLHEGQGHAARLRLVAQTIPPKVWVTELLADENQMEVRGYTLEPAALNDWVARLALNPVLQGQTLSAIKVERVSAEAPSVANVPNMPNVQANAARQSPTWAFTLVSAVTSSSLAAPGVRP